jgi:uncharacterized caspase-like protein
VGNNSYPESPLLLCENDARDMAAALGKIGYQVTLLIDAKKRRMLQEFREFVDRVPAGAKVVVHFSGHGCERRGENYLLPVDAVVSSDTGGCTVAHTHTAVTVV